MWLSMIWFIIVLFVCWNLFWIIANLRIKYVTETKNVSVLFYKNLKLSFCTWLTDLTLRFLYILGCSGPRCVVWGQPIKLIQVGILLQNFMNIDGTTLILIFWFLRQPQWGLVQMKFWNVYNLDKHDQSFPKRRLENRIFLFGLNIQRELFTSLWNILLYLLLSEIISTNCAFITLISIYHCFLLFQNHFDKSVASNIGHKQFIRKT